ncbi:MAG TPA: DUF4823 domain-containing protein [Nitrospiraceae bacterium]|nr:DUF4823 domain-containing protein [Nitrospiraceae bacterium]
MKKYLALMSLSFALLFGCADTHELMRASGSTVSLSSQASAYVAVPKDGAYGPTTYSGSGALTAQAVAIAFVPYLNKITVAVKAEDLESAQQSARTGSFTYLLYPQILHWEDRATEWSGKPDVVSVKVSLIRVESNEVLDSAVVGGKSGWATFGGDRPEHLLPKPLADYAATLFRR